MSRARMIAAAATVALACALSTGGLAPPGLASSSSWKLGIVLHARVAANHFDGNVVRRYAGLPTRIGERVTLRISRRSRCAQATAAGTRTIRCGLLGTLVAGSHDLRVVVTGDFETGHLGAIGFVASILLVQS